MSKKDGYIFRIEKRPYFCFRVKIFKSKFKMRTSFVTTTILIFLCSICGNSFLQAQSTAVLYSKKMADSQMKRSGTITSWDYPNGLFIESVLKIYDKYKDEKYYNYALSHAKATIDANGKIGSKYSFSSYNIDYVCPGMFLLGIYKKEKDNDKRYKVALDTLRKQLTYQPRNSQGGFWHKKIYPNQMWLDGIFMGSRYYANYDILFNEGKNLDDVIKQFTLIHSKTYDSEKQLNYHAWAENPNDANAFWARKEEPFKGCSHEFWARGNGWYFAALVDVLEILPENHPKRSEMLNILNEVAVGIKRWQDKESGLWYQLLEYDNSVCVDGKCNYLEASASSMYTYAMLKAVRLGFISKEEYLESGKKAYQGIISKLISEDVNGDISLDYICISAGLGPANSPERDGSIKYYLTGSDAGKIVSNDLKGVGPFIMASVEYETLNETSGIKNNKIEQGGYNYQYISSNYSVNVENEQHLPIQVNIYDLYGKMIAKEQSNSKLSLSLASYPKGLYFVKINNCLTDKIVKL